jgi:N-acetylglucosamine-6-phosphate deacetylase
LFGVHAEGPFLGEKKKGAHDARYLWKAERENYEVLANACGGWLRLLAIDPELEGAEDLIHRCKENGVTVSLAHTACGYDTACKAAEWGADHVTHLFNAMQPLHHREPGLIGAAVDKEMYVELICDGIHLHPAIIRMMFALCPEKVLLISDSMQAAGLSDGEYELGGIKVYVKDGKATQADGTIAGSTISVYDAVVNAIRFGIPEEQAVLSATYLPAKSVGLENEVGSIECGRMADFIVVDADWNLEEVYIGGKIIKKIF